MPPPKDMGILMNQSFCPEHRDTCGNFPATVAHPAAHELWGDFPPPQAFASPLPPLIYRWSAVQYLLIIAPTI
jgi:hypothetical protein